MWLSMNIIPLILYGKTEEAVSFEGAAVKVCLKHGFERSLMYKGRDEVV
jgi:hypothetical protein